MWPALPLLLLAAPLWSDALRGDARRLYLEGKDRFAAGEFEQCAKAFREAYAVTPEPHLLWNASACDRKAGHIASAAAGVERYLASGRLTAKEAAEANDSLAALRRLLAVVRVKSPLGHALLTVDQQPPRSIGAEAIDLWLDPGTHALEVSAEERLPEQKTVTVEAGQQVEWAVVLPPRPAAPASPVAEQVSVVRAAPAPAAKSRVGPFITGGAAIALAAGSAVLLGVARAQYGPLAADCAPLCSPQRISAPMLEERLAWSLGGIALFALAAAVLWLVLL